MPHIFSANPPRKDAGNLTDNSGVQIQKATLFKAIKRGGKTGWTASNKKILSPAGIHLREEVQFRLPK